METIILTTAIFLSLLWVQNITAIIIDGSETDIQSKARLVLTFIVSIFWAAYFTLF